MITVAQIRMKIQELAMLGLSLDEFEEWFSSASWNAHQSADPAALQLIGKIELALAENGAENEQVAAIVSLINLVSHFAIGNPRSVSSSGSVSVNPLSVSSVAADKRFAVEFLYTPLLPA